MTPSGNQARARPAATSRGPAMPKKLAPIRLSAVPASRATRSEDVREGVVVLDLANPGLMRILTLRCGHECRDVYVLIRSDPGQLPARDARLADRDRCVQLIRRNVTECTAPYRAQEVSARCAHVLTAQHEEVTTLRRVHAGAFDVAHGRIHRPILRAQEAG